MDFFEFIGKSQTGLIYFVVYICEILLACFMFSSRLKKKKNFGARAIIALTTFCVLSFFLPLLVEKHIAGLRSLTVMAIAIGCLVICYDHNFKDILFCAVAAFATENLASNIEIICLTAFTVEFASVFNYIIVLFVDAVVYFAAYYLCARKIKKNQPIGLNNIVILCISLSTFVIVTLLQFWLITEKLDKIIICRIPFAGLVIMSLLIQFGFLERSWLKQDNMILEQLLLKEGRQFEISKQNIEILNMKCHDLKNQVAALNIILTTEQMEEITKAAMIYDHIAKTGNKALDVILFEKGLLCEQNNIQFSYMIDGNELNIINPVDIASIFGNAIDNAIECVRAIPDKEKRIISLRVFRKNNLVCINIENYCENLPSFKQDGLPISTKNDDNYHGFGVKSIKFVVSKYNGTLAMEAVDKTFGVYILIPV